MAKKRSSKQKRSQIKDSVNKNESKIQEIISDQAIQLETITEQSVTDVIESLPTLRGALDAFVSPNILRGWAYSQEGANLRIRIVAGTSILGETPVNMTRSDLMQLNNGLTGWRLETESQLSEQEFVALAETIRVIILDESDNMIGQIPVWNKLLERLMAENSDALILEKKKIV